MTPHNEANKGDYAKTVIMPGDPKRAELIAKNYLTDYKLINDVRGIKAYTGLYKNKKVSVMASGMGIPSMGIYSYELYKYYDVDNIIRVGSCGNYADDLHLLDLILIDETVTESNYALTLNNENIHEIKPDEALTQEIENVAKEINTKITRGTTFCSECFDVYMSDVKKCLNRLPKKVIAAEMEAFALFYNAKLLNKKAAAILTIVDDGVHGGSVDSQTREKALTGMIELALETSLKL